MLHEVADWPVGYEFVQYAKYSPESGLRPNQDATALDMAALATRLWRKATKHHSVLPANLTALSLRRSTISTSPLLPFLGYYISPLISPLMITVPYGNVCVPKSVSWKTTNENCILLILGHRSTKQWCQNTFKTVQSLCYSWGSSAASLAIRSKWIKTPPNS